MTGRRLRFGLIVNPVAGIGGPVGLKGSDGLQTQTAARGMGGEPRSAARTLRTLAAMGPAAARADWYSPAGAMGGNCLEAAGVGYQRVGVTPGVSGPGDTIVSAQALCAAGVDLLVFSGGDGTARDLLEAVGDRMPVLGIPAGVKMHSGVFATTPERTGELLVRLLEGGLVSAVRREVRDLDEEALRRGELRPRYFGELRVPEPGGYLQHTKERGRENESLAVGEIAAYLCELITGQSDAVVLGPGSTLAAIKTALGFQGTLLGFDVWRDGVVEARDVNAGWLMDHVGKGQVILSFTRGQGFLIGRGNQQLTPEFLRRLGREALVVVGTRSKLASLDGRPLLLDTNDPVLDAEFSGLIEIIAGYEDRLFYRLAGHA
ncbi:MAG: ATP-NAD kinase family protein [Pseudomonadales bacterium]|nr:ATP-NAD kinase family protein [Pseudomonadales bacterium]